LTEQVYFPERQTFRNPMAYVVRTTTDPAELSGAIRHVVAGLDPQLPIYDVRPLTDYVVAARAARRFTMALAATFAMVALTLACVGVYGVIAYSVTRRWHEFGVRLALGARPGQVVRLLMREGAQLSVIGLALGTIGAALAARLLQGQLFGVTASDPVTYAIAIPALGAIAMMACWLPARRAMIISPMDALRTE